MVGESVSGSPLYDGHSFVVRQDSSNAFMPSPGRYLIQTTIGNRKAVTDVTVYRDSGTNNVTVRWSAPTQCSKYLVFRLDDPEQDYHDGDQLTPTPITDTFYTDVGAVGSDKYFYVVIAVY